MKKIIRLVKTSDINSVVSNYKDCRVVNVTGTNVKNIETYGKLSLDTVKTRGMNSDDITAVYEKQIKSLNANKVKKSLSDKKRDTVIFCNKEQFIPLMRFLDLVNQ